MFYSILFFIYMIRTIGTCRQNSFEHHQTKRISNDKNLYTIFFNFDHFNQLILECNQTYQNVTPHLAFVPNKEITIDASFNLRNILSNKELNSIDMVYVRHINGIDLNSNALSFDTNRNLNLYIYL